MEKSNEIAHVNAELIPQDNSADSDDKALSRRRVLEAGAAALALLMMPKLAFGATCPGGNPPDERGWFGSGNGSVVHHGGNYIGVTSKTWWWQVGYSWDASQWLCLSFRVYVESIFTDELYDIFKVHVQAKCGDVNTFNGHRIWFSKYKDNYLHFWVSNLGIAGSCQKTDWEDNKYFAFSNENLGGGNRWWWSITGWSDLGYDSPTYLYKRNNGLQDAYFGLGVYVYNVVSGGVNNWTTPDRVFLNGFTSSPDTFMGSDIHAKIDKITLDQDMSLFGKIVAIVPDSVKSGYQCLDVDAARQSSGTLVHLYGADGSGTNYTQRNFIMGLGAMDERGGITFTIFPAHVKGFSRVLNASGGRSYLEQAARNRTAPSSTQTLQLFGDDNAISGRFWVTKSVDKNGRYNIISDASGFAFDQADGKTAEGTIVRLHSDGILGSEWSNEAHKWRIEEVFFKGTISLDAERVEPGKTISVIDPSKTCTPYDQGGTGSVKYLYRWYWMKDERESPFAENNYPEAFTLSSWCHLANCGDQIWRDAYAGAGYGYMKDPNQKGHIIPDPVAAAVVERIFKMYLEGNSRADIARILNSEQIPPPGLYKIQQGDKYKNAFMAGEWDSCSISRILKEEMYIGNMVQGRQASESYKTKKLRTLPKEDWIRVIGTHEAIISLETWNQTQALLAVGARSFTRSEEIGLFSRKVYCGHCNKLMRTGRSKRKSGTYYNYVICVRRHPEINPCPVHAVSNALMEKTILDQLDILAAKYKDGSLFSEIMDEESTIGIEIKRLKAELAQHKKKLVEYETGLKCLYLDKASGSISNSDYQFLSRELSAGKELAERKVDLCTENYNKILRSQEILREKAGVLESYSRPKELTRSMVETFIDHIVICSNSDGTSKQEIKIYWNF